MNEFDRYISQGVICSEKERMTFMQYCALHSSFSPKKQLKCCTYKLFKKHTFEQFCDWYVFDFCTKKEKMSLAKKVKTILTKKEASDVLTKIYHKKVEVI